jgi:protein-L-isoaspartate(D-aspartate) O-methyltransferase
MYAGRRGWLVAVSVACWALLVSPAAACDEAAVLEPRRAEMLEVVQAHARAGFGPAAISPAVIAAMGRVERHEFVPEALRALAYEDRPLPIGYGQTISQPYIVALMTDLLEPTAGDRVLEIGTGSGYQAAVLAELGLEVYSIEIVPELGDEAAARLDRLGYDKVATRVGDGYYGWPERAPFDGLVVTAAAGHVPPPLIAQLKPGGRMIIPVGEPFRVQRLVLITKAADGSLRSRQLLPVRFVPLTGGR